MFRNNQRFFEHKHFQFRPENKQHSVIQNSYDKD